MKCAAVQPYLYTLFMWSPTRPPFYWCISIWASMRSQAKVDTILSMASFKCDISKKNWATSEPNDRRVRGSSKVAHLALIRFAPSIWTASHTGPRTGYLYCSKWHSQRRDIRVFIHRHVCVCLFHGLARCVPPRPLPIWNKYNHQMESLFHLCDEWAGYKGASSFFCAEHTEQGRTHKL